MAQELEDGEFWLPSDFLTDFDDLLTDSKTSPLKTKGTCNFSHGFGFNSDLSSPADSVIGAAEIESDEDEFIAGLTRKIANSFIQEGWKLSSSPKSTLCACKQGSTRSSPNSVSRVSTPTDSKDAVGWDLAAGEVERTQILEETTSFYSPHNLFASAPIHNPVYLTPIHAQAHLAYLQLQAKTFQQMQYQQQMINSRDWGKGKIEPPQCRRNQGLSTAAWPTLQQSQQPGSGMRAVFLGETDGKKERTGTGVFLPRSYGPNPTEARKKSGYSTVLLPERVVHALNLNVDAKSQLRGNKNFVPKYGSVVADQRQPLMNQATRPA
ncbi:hypothetical protein CASFOL_017378 [Castilleja foliolosa]|uniref:Uncharacterized protein n=1 Tax=Castilleja foliolosa TaxID=1961234 RepID=A0ABD3DAX5_9LAMI